MNILILAGGGHQSIAGEISYPTWLAEVDGTLLIERQINLLKPLKPNRFVFLFRHEDVEGYFLDSIVDQFAPGAAIVALRGETAGAACSALLAIEHIDPTEELVLVSATDQIDVDLETVIPNFRQNGADAGVFTFSSLHPRYSYVRTDADGWVVESSEKRPISRLASTGLYWFAKASDFFEGAKEMIIKDAHVQGKFYVCPVLNELILRQKKIAVHHLAPDQYHPLKSEKQVDQIGHFPIEEALP